MSSTHRRGPWSQQEDAYLMRLVQTQGALNWVRIAQTLSSRTPKQCRERYHQNLKPSLNHEPITPEEGQQIEVLVREIGKKWAEIARRLHGRSDNAVKNWWNGSQNRRKRLDRRRIAHAPTNYNDRRQGLSRPTLTLHPGLSLPPPVGLSPASPPYYNRASYPLSSPLLSPTSAGSPGSESLDGTLSSPSDSGSSHYTTSPFAAGASSPPNVDLPPIKALEQPLPRTFQLPTMSQLPRLTSLFPSCPAQVPNATRLPMSIGSHLPTAPNSPAPASPLQLSTRQVPSGFERDTKMSVAAILD